jgi:hypothetical protein
MASTAASKPASLNLTQPTWNCGVMGFASAQPMLLATRYFSSRTTGRIARRAPHAVWPPSRRPLDKRVVSAGFRLGSEPMAPPRFITGNPADKTIAGAEHRADKSRPSDTAGQGNIGRRF